MPRFFFHLVGRERLEDEEGVELPDIDAARRQAVKGARSLLCGELVHGRLPVNESIEVTDQHGAVLFVTRNRDVFEFVE